MNDIPGMTEVAEARARQLIASVENLPEHEIQNTFARMFKETVDGGAFTLFDLFLRAKIRTATDELVAAHTEDLCAAQAAVAALVSFQRDLFEREAEDTVKQTMSYLEISPYSLINRAKEGQVPFVGR